MKNRKAGGKKRRKGASLPHCGEVQRMVRLMKTFCPRGEDSLDCRSVMARMSGRGKEEEAGRRNRTPKGPGCEEKA